jgi:hypothetical protein
MTLSKQALKLYNTNFEFYRLFGRDGRIWRIKGESGTATYLVVPDLLNHYC